MLYGSYSYCTLGEGPNATVTKSAKWCVNAGAKLEICLIEGDVGDGMEVEAGHATGRAGGAEAAGNAPCPAGRRDQGAGLG